jgi:uncharacterized protein YeaO (DUF488 family)
MGIKSKSIYDPKKESDGTRVLLTQFYPRGVKKTDFDLWLRGASPEAILLREYQNKIIDWRSFSTKFRRQLGSSMAAKEAMKQLVELSRNRDVTILCYEKEGENCHRNIVKSITNNNNWKVDSGIIR